MFGQKSLQQFITIQRNLHLTGANYASPLRKKKAVNPLVTRKQYDRKVRRLEREISKLESMDLKFKPILELQLPPSVTKEIDARKRTETDDDSHKLLRSYLKIWSIFKTVESQKELQLIQMITKTQEKALSVLKNEYPELYNSAVAIDSNFIPYKIDTVKKDTPPIDGYNCPDGKEYDITKQWKL